MQVPRADISSHKPTIIVQSIADQVYNFVRRNILIGELAPLSPIRQDIIAAQLGVSKIPLREALAKLEHDGLVQSSPNKGFFVRPISAAEAREVFLLRLKLEPDATVEGSLAATKKDQEDAKQALLELEAVQSQVGNPEHVRYNRKFHIALMSPSMGQITYHIINQISILAERYVRLHIEPYGREKHAIQAHRELFEAWLEKDTKLLRKLTKEHLQSTLHDLEEELKHQ
ncbi:DNA-binding transcriptional regulator [Commensalibacter communis]|uniref:GntR family transcriptional regulator n=1 Tax=Commensalibacter communis TaxID=2972786 RepID=UPI0022FFA293|nr:GntR family transcriptional regulator [Commensalibacter communis]CAI3936830.1 DNA-binding transcriptional regulator [Commensalibacter communis]